MRHSKDIVIAGNGFNAAVLFRKWCYCYSISIADAMGAVLPQSSLGYF
jgi:hypothetical protein